MSGEVDDYYAELDRLLALPPSYYKDYLVSEASANQLHNAEYSAGSAFRTRQDAFSIQSENTATAIPSAFPSMSRQEDTSMTDLRIEKPICSNETKIMYLSPYASENVASVPPETEFHNVEQDVSIQSRKRSSREVLDVSPTKKRRIGQIDSPAVVSNSPAISSVSHLSTPNRERNSSHCHSSSIEDISMFLDEEASSSYKRVDSQTKFAAMSRPVQRQPAMKQFPVGKPTVPKEVHSSDGIEDISMFSAEGSPVKALGSSGSLSKTAIKAQEKRRAEFLKAAGKQKAFRTSVKTKGSAKRPPLTTVKEYTISVQDTPPGPNNFLKGKQICYVGKDGNYISQGTKNKIDLIIKHGGIVQVNFDPATTTLIITDADKSSTAKALGLKKIRDIPMHIPTVTWSWMQGPMGNRSVQKRVSILGKDATFEDLLEEPWKHAAFKERFEAGDQEFYEVRERIKAKAATKALSMKLSTIKQPTKSSSSNRSRQPVASTSATVAAPPPSVSQAPPILPLSPPSSPSPIKSKATKASLDPLEEFYDQARNDIQCGYETDDSDRESPLIAYRAPKRGWQCDSKNPDSTTSPNQDIVDKLEELRKLHSNKVGDDNHWRAYTYQKLIPILKALPKRITCKEDIRSIKGVGERTVQKVMEIVNTGNLRRIQYERTDDVKCTAIFQGIYGVGQSKALEWYQAGCRTLDDIKACKGGISLSTVQKIGLKYYDDINERMPRAEAQAIFELIEPIALRIDPKLAIDIMGSFRRGKATCGDIDILITRPTDDGGTHAGVMEALLGALHESEILTEDLSLPSDMNELECSYRGLCRLPNIQGSLRRRIDILCIPWHSRSAALLYYTGDDIFNRSMRLKANKMGYSLNQRGLWAGVIRDSTNRMNKLDKGTIIASENEEQIFEILGVPWQEPHERVRN